MVSSDALESKMIKDEKERWTRASTQITDRGSQHL